MRTTTLELGATSGEVASKALGRIGARLHDAGLTARGLAAWSGTDRLAGLPARLGVLTARVPTPAAALLALFVGGAEIAQSMLRIPGTLLDELIAHDLVECSVGCLRARVAIVPLARALLVCDRHDAASERDRVCWPDDSSYHLATAVPPGRRPDWLDVGCGSAFAALSRPELGIRITGLDITERAVRYARVGAALSGITHLAALRCDVGAVGAGHEVAELVTCNAPIPEAGLAVPPGTPALPEAGSGPSAPPSRGRPAATAEVWRHADPGLFERLWPALRNAVRSGGTIVVHAAADTVLPALRAADGERVVVTYTPDTVRGFAVAWWRPDAPDRFAATHRALTPERPHIDTRDLEDARGR